MPSDMPPHPPGPLSSLRILDFSRLLPGPFATGLMADLGATVIRVDDPAGSDYLTRIGEPLDEAGGALFHQVNRGKRRITLDLKNPLGVGLARRILATCDALVESFRPGVMDRLGLGWDTLSRDQPGLVFVSVTGYGQDGPWAGRAGHDLNYMAVSGLLGADPDPRPWPTPMADLAGGGLGAALGLLAAVVEARDSGHGRHVDLSMTHMTQYLLAPRLVQAPGTRGAQDTSRVRADPLGGGNPAYGTYRTKDGRWLAVSPLEPRFWDSLARVLGLGNTPRPSLEDPTDWHRLRGRMEEIFAGATAAEWMARLDGVDACVEPVLEPTAALDHPQARHRSVRSDRDASLLTSPFRMDPALREPEPRAASPNSGTPGILEEIGLDTEEIRTLTREGAFGPVA